MIQGFTLIETLCVIVLIGIIGTIAMPVFRHSQVFEERFFIDEMLTGIQLARKMATTTGCEVQVGYKSNNELAIFQRENCKTGVFSKITYSNTIITIPRSVVVKGNIPLYIDSEGRIKNENQAHQQKLHVLVNNHEVIIDGLSGLAYEKSKRLDAR